MLFSLQFLTSLIIIHRQFNIQIYYIPFALYSYHKKHLQARVSVIILNSVFFQARFSRRCYKIYHVDEDIQSHKAVLGLDADSRIKIKPFLVCRVVGKRDKSHQRRH